MRFLWYLKKVNGEKQLQLVELEDVCAIGTETEWRKIQVNEKFGYYKRQMWYWDPYIVVDFLEADEDEEADFEHVALPSGKIGAKKMRKLQEKEEKARMREVNAMSHITFLDF